jgi:hypothetical protein
MSFPIKAWIRFYFKLSLVAAWNGVIKFIYVVSGGAIAQCAEVVDVKTLGMKGWVYILIGTVLASVGAAWMRHQLPEPNEPTQPTLTPTEAAAQDVLVEVPIAPPES